MNKFVVKRDGNIVDFNGSKIVNAVIAAMKATNVIDYQYAVQIAKEIEDIKTDNDILEIEYIQDLVEKKLMDKYKDVAKNYILYRNNRTVIRNQKSKLMKQIKEKLNATNIENSNANVDERGFSARKNEASGIITKEIAATEMLDPEVKQMWEDNLLYLHDFTEYAVGMHNCLNVDLDHMLLHGWETRNGSIRGAKSFNTACQHIAIILQSQSCVQFGGVGVPAIDYTLAPFVRMSFLKHYQNGLKYTQKDKKKSYDDFKDTYKEYINTASIIAPANIFKDYSNNAYKYALNMLENEGWQSAEALYANLNSLESRPGSQLPFSSYCTGLNTTFEGRFVTRCLLNASIDGIGHLHQTSTFPISVFTYKHDINDRPGTPNYDLFKLAIKSTVSRLFPNYVSADWVTNKPDIHPTYLIDHPKLEDYQTVNIYIHKNNKLLDSKSNISISKLYEECKNKYGESYNETDKIFYIDMRFINTPYYIDDDRSSYKDYNLKLDDHIARINYISTNEDHSLFSITTDSFSHNYTGNELYKSEYIDYKYDHFTEMSTMGSAIGREVITYKLNNILFVESFERAWNRVSAVYGPVLKWKNSSFVETPEGLYIYDSYSHGFTQIKRFIRNNDIGCWNKVIFDDRVLYLTNDHPLPTQRGRIFVKDLVPGDEVPKSLPQYSEIDTNFIISKDVAWLWGIILCDGCYQDGHVFCCFGLDEKELADKAANIFKNEFGLKANITQYNKGEKGNYYQVDVYSTELCRYFEVLFEGLNKIHRHIPNIVFSKLNYDAKCAFLAGMIDADGYVRKEGNYIDIGSTNQELAIQEGLLGFSLGLPYNIFINYYKGHKYKDKIRYKTTIHKHTLLENNLICDKKKKNFGKYDFPIDNSKSKVITIEPLGFLNEFGYDVETESDHFDVSGINSHNCRTLLIYNRNKKNYSKIGRGNVVPHTINMVKLGIKYGICLGERDKPDIDGFWKELDKILKITEKSLIDRYNYICAQSPKSGAFMYNNKTILDSDESIKTNKVEPSQKNNTLAIGFAGISNALYALFGKYQNQDDKVKEFGNSIIKRMYEYVKEASDRNDLNFSLYATPLEGACYTIMNKLKSEYGIIKGVTDREYVNNSYHVPPYEKISIKRKIDIESEYTKYCTGGNITYVELDSNLKNNLDAVEDIIRYAMDKNDHNIAYFAINIPLDMCTECGYQAEINDKCPKCGADTTKIQRLRRITGYLNNDYKTSFNPGKQAEVEDRVKHSKYTNIKDLIL